MGTICIYVDSSTKGSDGTKYGESIAAWMLKWKRSSIMARCGVVYLHKTGPNKAFYEGVIAAFESGLTEVDNGYGYRDDVEVYGDCQTVIKQLTGEWNVGQLHRYYDYARELERKFKGRVTYEYLSEQDATYKRVDKLSKLGHGLFKQVT